MSKSSPLVLGRGIAMLSTSIALATAANAQTSLVFEPFKAADISNPSLNVINIEGIVIETPDGIRIGIMNNSMTGDGWITSTRPTVHAVYIDGSPAAFGTQDTASFNSSVSSPGVKFVDGGSPPDLPGGSEIGFTTDILFTATPPPPKNGMDPGEVAYFDFVGADYHAVLGGLFDGSARIGLHILECRPQR
jgi:hypothetical protein